ncbi:MAG TPA: helix-turn-helix domain-containing protein [Atribacteraceae bacterium]|nr:helix-turn-helix domain-containing protein [Atribacteraceae bacterium]
MTDLRKAKMEAAVYNIPEVAALLDVNLIRAYELARQHGFPSIRISEKRIVVPRAAFHRWLETAAHDRGNYSGS